MKYNKSALKEKERERTAVLAGGRLEGEWEKKRELDILGGVKISFRIDFFGCSFEIQSQ